MEALTRKDVRGLAAYFGLLAATFGTLSMLADHERKGLAERKASCVVSEFVRAASLDPARGGGEFERFYDFRTNQVIVKNVGVTPFSQLSPDAQARVETIRKTLGHTCQ